MMNKSYKKVYICHPYASDPDGNVESVLEIVKDITSCNEENYSKVLSKDNTVVDFDVELIVPVAVHLLFPKFMSEDTFGREIAMDFCLSVLEGCDEIWVYGPTVSSGMRQEITFAGENEIKIVWKNFD